MSYEYAGTAFDTISQALRALVSNEIVGEELAVRMTPEQYVDCWLDIYRRSDNDEWMSFHIIGTDERESYSRDDLIEAARLWIAELLEAEEKATGR